MEGGEGKEYERAFIRSRLNSAFRTGWACFVATALAQLSKAHSQWMAFPIFSYVIAVTVVGESRIGGGLQTYVDIIVGSIQGVVMAMFVLVFLINPAHIDFWIAVSCVSLSTILIVYPKSTHLLSKRIALAHTGIFYISAYNQRAQMDPVIFPLRIAATTLVGATSGLVALVLPLPRFAILHIGSQLKLSIRITHERLRAVVDSFCENNRTKASFLALRNKSLATMDSDIISSINSKEGDMAWEVVGTTRKSEMRKVVKGLKPLKKQLAGMELSVLHDLLSSSNSNNKSTSMRDELRESLIYLTDWACLALLNVNSDSKNKQNSAEKQNQRQAIIAEADSALLSFERSLNSARQKCSLAMEGMISLTRPCLKKNMNSFFFLFLLKSFAEETKRLIESVSQRSQALKEKKPKATISHHDSTDLEAGGSMTDLSELCKQSNGCNRCSNKNVNVSQEAPRPDDQTASNWIKGFFSNSVEIDSDRLIRAMKTCLAMAAATIIGTLFDKSHGYWGVITLSLGFVINTGGSFRVAYQRAQGTVAGSIYGLLVGLATQKVQCLRMVAMVPWVIFSSFLRKSPAFGYSGAVSVFTGGIVMLGQIHNEGDRAFFIIRVVEAFVGMVCFILVELLILPTRSATEARKELIPSIRKLREAIAAILEAQSGEICVACATLELENLKAELAALKTHIGKQKSLAKDTQAEPDFWFTPFPLTTYSSLVETQTRVAELLYYACSSLESLLDLCRKEDLPIQAIHHPFRGALEIVSEKVLSTLLFLEKVLQVKPLRRILPRSQVNARKPEVNVQYDRETLGVEVEQAARNRLSRLLEEFDKGFQVLCSTAMGQKVNGTLTEEVVNGVLLCVSGLTFSCHGLLKETVEIEKGVHELLQIENPWSLVDFHDTSVSIGQPWMA